MAELGDPHESMLEARRWSTDTRRDLIRSADKKFGELRIRLGMVSKISYYRHLLENGMIGTHGVLIILIKFKLDLLGGQLRHDIGPA